MLILPKRCVNPIQGATDRERRDVPPIFGATALLFYSSGFHQKLRQLRHVGRNPPRLVFCVVIDLSQMSLWMIHRLRSAVHRNCGGHIHAVFICVAPLFCKGEGSSKQ